MNSSSPHNDAPISGDADTVHHEHTFRDYRAPRLHGQSLVQPSFADAGRLISDNLAILAQRDEYWQTLRQRARRQLVDDAIRYTSAYRDVGWVKTDADTPLIMAGHQPTIFHPGVWFKNFALSKLAQDHQALAINLIVDNDVASGSSLRVPTIDTVSGIAAYRHVPYDQAGGGTPYEQAVIHDRETFDRFDRSVTDLVSPLVANPCVHQLWKHARAAIDRCGVAGCALAQARHGLEADIGLQTLEIPLAVACRSDAFIEFALSILTQTPRFHRCYNESADVYRKAHGIRSSAHPVPNLAHKDGWFEAPLWIYGNESPTRRAAWVKLSGNQLQLSDLGDRQLQIDITNIGSATSQLIDKLGPEFKLRPRALLTTMYARTVLSDLFLHGIGGAKYDQLGDMITQSFFGIEPADFMVLSATILLPGVQNDNNEIQIRSLKRKLRETQFQPERFADQLAGHEELLARKRQLLDAIPPRGDRREWHREITSINTSLAAQLNSVRADFSQQLAKAHKLAAGQTVLASREHPFCVFPLDYLTETFAQLSKT